MKAIACLVVVLLLLAASSSVLAQEPSSTNSTPQAATTIPVVSGTVRQHLHPVVAVPEGVQQLKRFLVSRTVAEGIQVGVGHSGVIWTIKW